MKNKYVYMLLLVLAVFCKQTIGQVNLQTGSAVFSLPMFNWQDSKSRLSLNIGLNYNSGNGLKVDEIPSNVGTGWNLMAGGVISRIQVGQPDDQKPREGLSNDINKYPAGYLYNSRAGNPECPTGLSKYPIYNWENQLYKQHNNVDADRELDYFSFQFNGRSGMFFLNKLNPNQCYTLGDSKLKISFQIDETIAAQKLCRTTIMSFQITDENGVVYKFKNLGLTRVLEIKPCTSQKQILSQTPQHQEGNIYYEYAYPKSEVSYVVNSWYLSEIIDPPTSRKITLNYQDNLTDNYVGYGINFYGKKKYYPYFVNGQTQFQIKDVGYIKVSYRRSFIITPILQNISLTDGYTVDFAYQTRLDVSYNLSLSNVRIKLNNIVHSGFNLKNGYLTKNQILQNLPYYAVDGMRLCLLEVEQFGPNLLNSLPPYKFEYYLGSNATEDFVPPLFCGNKDYAGYYNGDYAQFNSNTICQPSVDVSIQTFETLKNFCYIKSVAGSTTSGEYNKSNSGILVNPKPNYAKNGLLKRIYYPTKGYLQYEYEQNIGKINNSGTDQNIAGVHVNKTSLFVDATISTAANVSNYSYVQPNNGNSSLWGAEMPKNLITSQTYYSPEDREFTAGDYGIDAHCYWEYQFPGILEVESILNQNASQNFLQSIAPILNIISLAGWAVDIYTAFFATSCNPVGLIVDVVLFAIGIVVSCTSDDSNTEITDVYSNGDLNASNPLPSQFAFVEIEQIGSGPGNGKIEYEFTKPYDIAGSGGNYAFRNNYNGNPFYTNKQRSDFWLYGQPYKISVYDATGKIVKQTENLYSPPISTPLTGTNSCNCFVKRMESFSYRGETGGWWMDFKDVANNHLTANNSEIEINPYMYYTGRLELASTIEKVYRPDIIGSINDPNNYLQTTIDYYYNAFNFQVNKIITTQTNGDKNIKEIFYATDFNTSDVVMNTLKSNYINTPISSYISEIKSGSSIAKYLSASVTEFGFINGDIKPVSSYVGRPLTPVSYTFNTANPKNFTDLVKTQDLQYDNKGNLIALKDEGNHIVSNIYGYDDKYIIASVINADLVTDKPAYTSFETNDYGGWNITGTPTIIIDESITGSKVLSLNNSVSLNSTLNISKSYIVSFWANTNSVNLSIGTMLKSSPSVNGYTYYEYEIASGNTTITISGNGNIDELRLYPTNARMRTVAFNPLLGKTSECDENNRITYYEYDNLGRLQAIKDEHKNILKTYEYNYKN